MAQAGYTPISLYYSTTALAAPTAPNLADGELAINITDGKLYYKDNAGVIQVIASKAAAGGVTTFSAGTTGLTPSTATGGAVTLAGTLAVANGGTNATTIGAAGGVPYSTGTAYAFTAAGTSGQILTSAGAGAPTWSTLSSVAVTTLSFGTTGLTPNSATSGAITVAGTLATTNGGTGLTAFTSGGAVYATSTSALTTGTLPVTAGGTGLATVTASQIPYGNGTSALSTSANLTFTGTNLVVAGTGYSPNITLTDAATIAWDTSLGQVATFTFVATNRTVGAPTNLVNGGFYALAVIQNAGSNTLTWNAVFKFPNAVAPTLSTAAGAKDYFVFRSDGTNMYLQGQSLGVA